MNSLTIDARLWDASGIGVYLQALLPRLAALLPHKIYIIHGTDTEPFSTLPNITYIACDAGMYSLKEQYTLPRLIPRNSTLWVPHYNIPLLYRGKLLVTVHDVAHLALPEVFGAAKRLYARALLTAVRQKAAHIFFVSEFTENSFIQIVGKPRGTTSVVHNGVEESWFAAKPTPRDQPYFIAVGNVKPHKNLGRLVEAFLRVADKIPHTLLLVGKKDGFRTGDNAILAAAEQHPERIQFTGFVPTDALQGLVAGAEALVMPSYYEGFGLPPLEAMACGTPCIVSNAASLHEVCGDAALYINPFSVDDIAEKLLHLAGDGALRETLRTAGLQQARRFSWDKAAGEMAGVLGLQSQST
jgi:glycosyltransferase involved in cell wall biosynthesis